MQATLRTGPVGTGAYLLGHRGSWGVASDVDVWLLLLFFPLVPLSRWRITASSVSDGSPEGEAVAITLHSRSRIPLGAALGRIARALGVTVLAWLPFAFEVWIGEPWASRMASRLLGGILSSMLLSMLEMPIEMGMVAVELGIPILILMHLDWRTPRVSLRSALWPRSAQRTASQPTNA